MIRLALLFALLGAPAAALDLCAEYWFTRNQIFDRAGYCFGSPLGAAIFDNGDCTTSAPALSPADKALAERLAEEEGWLGCRTDTSATALAIPGLAQRLRLEDIPVPAPYESACLGWTGERLVLRSGRSAASAATGVIQPGETILWSYEEVGGWGFFISESGNGMGWAPSPPLNEETCEALAG
ncbi:DUF4453 domain-containing protein [Pseudoroseicyclus sp. CXY001]|uniref:DUF4453 domain-containing protein n=1 Tax=Pseudoroseicyclus sp. CXY001 TaxID=3242492 RepID=UPI0035710BA4